MQISHGQYVKLLKRADVDDFAEAKYSKPGVSRTTPLPYFRENTLQKDYLFREVFET